MSMYIVSWNVRQTIDNKPTLVDHWQVSETWEHAQEMYNVIKQGDEIYCAAIAQIVVGTEPHWYEDENDYDDGQPTWEQEWQDFGEVYDDEPNNI